MATRTRKRRRSRYVVRWLGVGALAVVCLLYARPLRSYLATKHELARRTADVRALKLDKRALQHRLAQSATPEAMTREARRLGFVHSGEHLFIVKGISAWLRSAKGAAHVKRR